MDAAKKGGTLLSLEEAKAKHEDLAIVWVKKGTVAVACRMPTGTEWRSTQLAVLDGKASAQVNAMSKLVYSTCVTHSAVDLTELVENVAPNLIERMSGKITALVEASVQDDEKKG